MSQALERSTNSGDDCADDGVNGGNRPQTGSRRGDLSIEYRPLQSLVPYVRNARTHSDAQVAQIAGSIREFGWTNPILADGGNGVIAGHGRVLAARKLGMDNVPVIELSGMSEAKKRTYVLAYNKLALNAGWDEDLLTAEVADLASMGVDLALAGFEEVEIERLLGAIPWHLSNGDRRPRFTHIDAKLGRGYPLTGRRAKPADSRHFQEETLMSQALERSTNSGDDCADDGVNGGKACCV
jgi:hypothetical protein